MRSQGVMRGCPHSGAAKCVECQCESGFPSAFSSQAEWDECDDERAIDIPSLASKISLMEVSQRLSLSSSSIWPQRLPSKK